MAAGEYAGVIAASPYSKKGSKIKPPNSCKEMNKILKKLNNRAIRL
jgi:hypothetical protein